MFTVNHDCTLDAKKEQSIFKKTHSQTNKSWSRFLFVCLNGPQILDPVAGRPLVGFSLKPKGLACL